MKNLTSKDYESRGLARLHQKHFEHALSDFDTAMELCGAFDYDYVVEFEPNQRYRMLFYYRGIANYNLGNYSAALHDYDSAIELGLDYSAELYFQRGLVERVLGVGAIYDFIKAIQLNPNHADAYYHKGMQHISDGHTKAACLALNKAAEFGNEQANEAIRKYCQLP